MNNAEARTAGWEGWRGATTIVLVALPALLYAYMPRPPLAGAHLLVYPALGAAAGGLLVFFLSRQQLLDVRLVRIGFLLLLLNAVVVFSLMANAGELRATAPTEILRVPLIVIFLLYGYCVARLGGQVRVRRGLLLAAYTILVGQTIISAAQIAGVPIFDALYSAEKSRPFGSLLRATGSLANPNLFAWLVAQAGIIAFLLESRRIRYLALFLAMLLVLAAGSRTLFVLFPCMVAFATMMARRHRRRYYLLLGGVIAAAFVLTVYLLAEYLPYLAQLKLFLASGSLRSINSFNVRVLGWQEGFSAFSDGGWAVWLIGLGARPSTAVLDNDFLYMLFKFGIIGLLIHLGLACYTGYLFFRARRRALAIIGMQYLLFSLLFGLVSETLGGWHNPLLLFLILGLTVGLQAGPWPVQARPAVATSQRTWGDTAQAAAREPQV